MKLLNPRAFVLFGVFALGLTASAGAAKIVADFKDGNSTTLVDAWIGTGGNGWVEQWRDSRNFTDYTASVKDTNSLLPGSGNYLSASFKGQSGGAVNKQGYVARKFRPDSVTSDQQLSVSFLFRPDIASGSGQYYSMMFNANGIVQGTGPNNMAVINSGTSGEKRWVFSGKESTDSTALNKNLDSGIAVIAGNVYSFDVTLDLITKSYMASVTDLTKGVSYTTTEAIYFRYTGNVNEIALEFGAFLGTGTGATGTLEFSLDNIAVNPIPEASTIAVVFGAVALSLVFLRRRARIERA